MVTARVAFTPWISVMTRRRFGSEPCVCSRRILRQGTTSEMRDGTRETTARSPSPLFCHQTGLEIYSQARLSTTAS